MLDVRICEYCMKKSYSYLPLFCTHIIYISDGQNLKNLSFLFIGSYWILEYVYILDFRMREYCMKNVIHIYKMTHSVFLKTECLFFKGSLKNT